MFVEARDKIGLKKVIFPFYLRISVSLVLLTSIFFLLGLFSFSLHLPFWGLSLSLTGSLTCLITSLCSSSSSAYLHSPWPRPLAFAVCSIFPLSLLCLLFSLFFFSLSSYLFFTHILLHCLLSLPSFPGWKPLLSLFFLFFPTRFLHFLPPFCHLPAMSLASPPFSSSSISLPSRPPRLDPLPGSCVG